MARSILLGVNIDHIATLRQARGTRFPDPVYAAAIAEQAGADGITLHLREDRRHIQERDINILKQTLQTPMNLEMAVTDEMLKFAVSTKPENCCLVPERRQELTTEGGLDVKGQLPKIKKACELLANAGIRVSLFIDANNEQIDAAIECKAPVIEIHTGHYANANTTETRQYQLALVTRAVEYAHLHELQVNAGHGLDYHNVTAVAGLEYIVELNIGHSIISQSLFSGLADAVHDMKQLMEKARVE